MISKTSIAIGPNLALFTDNSTNSGKFQDRHLAFYKAISLPSKLQVFGVLPEYAIQEWSASSLITDFLSTALKNGEMLYEILATHDNTMHSIIDLGTSDILVTIRIYNKADALLCSLQIAIDLYSKNIRSISEL